MQAFILAAGLGTRLHPLTDQCPKALVEVNGMPLLHIAIDNLVQQGINHIVINVHHFAEMVCDYLSHNAWNAEICISDEREMLLDTGGALKKAETLFKANESILIHNVDILSRSKIQDLFTYHHNTGDIATLAVCQRKTSRYLLFDNQKQLIGWKNNTIGETRWVNSPTNVYNELAFSGISVIEPQLLQLLPPATHPYPVIPEYLSTAKHHKISYFLHSSDTWLDVGTPEKLNLAQQWNLSSQK